MSKKWTQIVVFTGLLLPEEERKDFEKIMKRDFHVRVKYLDEYTTERGFGGEGGRIDVLCRIHPDDVASYATARFAHGEMRGVWWEDAVDNWGEIMPEWVLEKYKKTW